jgi:small-conductance mechanosensitive channel
MNNHQPAGREPFRVIKGLLLGYLGIGIAALVAVVLLRNHPAEVNGPAWVRSIIVVATALILLSAATLAGRGSRGAFLRLRIISIVTTVAIVVIVALPGTFPVWLKIEQSVCGVLMLGVALLANGRTARSRFADRQSVKQSVGARDEPRHRRRGSGWG